MKLSTRIKKEISPELIAGREVVLFVDCKTKYRAANMAEADALHDKLISGGCKLLKQESPVINGIGEIICHYTTTNYRNWCN